MCGIWSFLSKNKISSLKDLNKLFNSINGRGPEVHNFHPINDNLVIGFHRLKINDISELGNQPFHITQENELEQHDLYLICNGEIYNHEKLKLEHNIVTKSNSDCEIILHLFLKIGIKKTLKLLDGVFAGIIIDTTINKNTYQFETKLYAFRDPIGVRPLFLGHTDNTNIGFCSEIKGLVGSIDQITPVLPGTCTQITFDNNYSFEWSSFRFYYYDYPEITFNSEKEIYHKIRETFTESVKKRLMSDRPICCLLSGGLDSSLVASIMAKCSKEKIHTFCCGMKGGTDFKWAKKVADHIGSIHHEVYFEPEEGIEAIFNVIKATETFDITTIRASVGQYLVSKFVSENTDFKVVYIGDGSDELVGGYKYFCNSPTPEAFHKECVRLMRELYLFDVLRADRAVSCHGLETRVPFLDKEFIKLYLSIDPKLRVPQNGIEKYLLRKSFDCNEYYLPNDVLWREKEAFSDGVSSKTNSWFEIIQKFINSKVTDEDFEKTRSKYPHCIPPTKEALYFRTVFDQLFGDKYCNVIPKFWLPKWCGNLLEPSARVLSSYGRDDKKSNNNI